MRYLLYSFILLMLIPIHASAQDVAIDIVRSIETNSVALDAIAYSPDGLRFATGGRDNIIRVWDSESGDLLMETEGHADWVTSLAFTANGTQIISGSRDGSVRVFDATSGALLSILGQHDNHVTSVAITDNGYVASGGRDKVIKLWHMESGSLVSSFDHFGQAVLDLAFDPTGTYLASASDDGMIWLWGIFDENNVWLKQLIGHTDSVNTLAFSENGDLLLSGSVDGSLRLWDVSDLASETLDPLASFYGHFAPIMGVGFSADGRVAISSSLDGTVRLWDVSGAIDIGSELSTLSNGVAPLTNLVTHPNQSQAITVGTDGRITAWDISSTVLDDLIESVRPAPVVVEQPSSPPSTNASPSLASAPPAPVTGRALSIPNAGINVGVTSFPLGGGTWQIDPWEPLAGHFQGTSWIDSIGNVVIGAHSEMPNGTAGVFLNLYNVGIGDEIFVQDGTLTRRYIVVNIRSVDYRDVSVVYPTSHNRLTLITCDIPSYVVEQNIYYERLVIIADEVPL
ncbi:MAG: sortase [Chloroflexota bacterium]